MTEHLDRSDVLDKLNAEFERFDPRYKATKRAMAGGIALLQDRLHGFQKRGEPLYRSAQILDEAVWLHHYTADWNRLHRRLHDLRVSLCAEQRATADQKTPTQSANGAFDAGATEWFIGFDATVDNVQVPDLANEPLRFLAPYLDPGRLLARLHAMQLSDIARTGINDRAELNMLQNGFIQFLKNDWMRGFLADPALWPRGATATSVARGLDRFRHAFYGYLDQTQHPDTGFWGPWYVIDERLLKLNDLSCTFHITNCRDYPVKNWPRIIATTLELGEHGRVYPYGWRPAEGGEPFSNHNNMDIVRLFRKGFKEVGRGQRHAIGSVIGRMLAWCLTRSLTDGGRRFRPEGEIELIDSYQSGVSFLRLAGYWSAGGFWWDGTVQRDLTRPDPRLLAQTLLDAVRALHSRSSYAEDLIPFLTKAAEGLVPDE